MKSSWKLRLLRELAFVVIIGTPVLLFFLVMSPRSHATRLLRQLRAVEVSQTQFEKVQTLAQHYGSSAACVGDNCLFQFQNAWLHWLRLAPMTEFSVMVRRHGEATDAGGGHVGAIDMAMLVSRNWDQGGAIASALVFDQMDEQGLPPYEASIVFGADGQPGRTVVRMTPRASRGLRRSAREFNLGCLTRIGGCRNSHQLLPNVWRGARRIQSASRRSPASPTLAAVN
ncbi:MAG: hypothetical protein ACRD04_03315 [Terriglobales bacterium]